MNTSGIRRNFKNIVHNYSDAQVKVREATSNDPWGPSSTLMSEIADYTYNMVAFSEIMQMIWKRLNDHGKNWRHVYKALVLLEYLIKTGTEKVAQQCKENIFAIQTLKDFQFFEENKDHGLNVREKAKQLVALLKDDERLKNERMRAIKARERFAQATSSTGTGSELQNSTTNGNGFHYSESHSEGLEDATLPIELECARPQTAGEEELQLQLALAMSKEEAEQEEQKRRSDDMRLQMAITQSEDDFRKVSDDPSSQKPSNLLDLLDMDLPGPSQPSVPTTDPWGLPVERQQQLPPRPVPPRPQEQNGINDCLGFGFIASQDNSLFPNVDEDLLQMPTDPWAPHNPASTRSPTLASDPWVSRPASSLGVPAAEAFNRPQADPWSAQAPAPIDPWGMPTSQSFGSSPSLATNGDLSGFDPMASRNASSKSANNLDTFGGLMDTGSNAPNPFGVGNMGQSYPLASGAKKTPENFLGENSNLVNLDALISSHPPSQIQGSTNPFASATTATGFQSQPARVSLNQLRTHQQQPFTNVAMAPGYGGPPTLAGGSLVDPFAPNFMPAPLVPAPGTATAGGTALVDSNPFL